MTQAKKKPEKKPDKKKKKKFRYITPPNILKQKVGAGGLAPERLEKAERFIDSNALDFAPYAKDILKRLDKAFAGIKSGNLEGAKAVEAIAGPVMELKANGGMFKYKLISDVADVMLDFLERVDELNEDGMDIADVHQRTVHTIIASGLEGSGGPAGQALAGELRKACQRYFKKYKIDAA